MHLGGRKGVEEAHFIGGEGEVGFHGFSVQENVQAYGALNFFWKILGMRGRLKKRGWGVFFEKVGVGPSAVFCTDDEKAEA